MNKKDGGIITKWQFHTLTTDMEYVKEARPELDFNVDKAIKFSGTIKEDPTGRWQVGDHMRSSLVVKFDKDTQIVETENTIYTLDGPEGDPTFGNQDIGPNIARIFY